MPASELLNRDDYTTYLTQFNLEIQSFLTSQLSKKSVRQIHPVRTKRPLKEYEFRGLGAYGDGLIRYDGTPVELQYHLIQVCRLFLSKPGHLVGFDKIAQELWPTDSELTPGKRQTIAKYVSELRIKLKARDEKFILESIPKEGWILKSSA